MKLSRARVAAALGIAAVVAAGCATRPPRTLANRFVRGVDGPVSIELPPMEPASDPVDPSLPPPPSEPVPKTDVPETIERTDTRLAGALTELAKAETSTTLRRAAVEYHRVGVFDRAEALLSEAIRLDRTDAAAFAARARVWRDWGLPALGLADAHRAVYFAPAAADAQATLGSVLVAIGEFGDAATAYARAVELAPGEAWALNNLCYASLLAGKGGEAERACEAALAADSQLVAARHNLALVQAATGRIDEAEATLLAGPDHAGALYNIGLIRLARGLHAEAATSFEGACRERPAFDDACRRALDARRRAGDAGSGGGR